MTNITFSSIRDTFSLANKQVVTLDNKDYELYLQHSNTQEKGIDVRYNGSKVGTLKTVSKLLGGVSIDSVYHLTGEITGKDVNFILTNLLQYYLYHLTNTFKK